MSRGALSGEHYCERHQGNHSHYAEHNCAVCKAVDIIEALYSFCPMGMSYMPADQFIREHKLTKVQI